jgi:hypothetical protein
LPTRTRMADHMAAAQICFNTIIIDMNTQPLPYEAYENKTDPMRLAA